MAPQDARPVEVWGGIECTVNRVGDRYHDQFALSGHDRRIDDLDLVASLGIRTLRYPVLWERHAGAPPGVSDAAATSTAGEAIDWRWTDERLSRLRELGITPIAGLVHHGSGPPWTSLLDPGFAPGLAAHAARVARRYPWIDWYTPVNEPLTTARFSTLYAAWYPHARDGASFARAVVNQCRATVLAMREIRRINPAAKLVQTDDLGRTHSTPGLAYQAEFENERRWLAWDLLCGRVDRGHRMWRELRRWGVGEEELDAFLESPCPPDVLGVNHYLTSERFLDEDFAAYPAALHGANAFQRYADCEVVRVHGRERVGWAGLLREAWQRYRLPIAITEAHLGCTREEQLRWLDEAWRAAHEVRDEGADLRAVTAWALLGSCDWNSLVTRIAGHYEPGAFDVRGGVPRLTALGRHVRTLAAASRAEAARIAAARAGARRPHCAAHPVLASPGWWDRDDRLLYRRAAEDGAGASPSPASSARVRRRSGRERPILVTGAGGTLGRAFQRVATRRGLACRALPRRELDLEDAAAVGRALEECRPWAVINAAGFVRVDEAERESDACFRRNHAAAVALASACVVRGVRLLAFSSDLVFDGGERQPYRESAAVRPLNVYGRSKARMEADVLATDPDALVVRTSAFFGPWDAANFLHHALGALARGEPFAATADVVVSPTYVPDLVDACLDLLVDGERGVWHLANDGAVTWEQFARMGAEAARVPSATLEARRLHELGLPAARPLYSALASERAVLLPPLADAVERYVASLPESFGTKLSDTPFMQ